MEVLRERNGSESIEAVIAYIQAVGPNVKIRSSESTTDNSSTQRLSKDRQRELKLKTGEHVYVKPRQVRVFIGEPPEPLNYQI